MLGAIDDFDADVPTPLEERIRLVCPDGVERTLLRTMSMWTRPGDDEARVIYDLLGEDDPRAKD